MNIFSTPLNAKTLVCLVFFIAMYPIYANGATYYVSPSGSGTTCSSSSRCTLSTGLSKLSSGDTLIIGNGDYSGYISSPVSGTSSAYTTIKAENDGGAIITYSGSDHLILTLSSNYVRIEGLKFVANVSGSTNDVAFIPGSYNKIFRCAFVSTPDQTGGAADNNHANVTISGRYNLLEDCWAWGGGRYKFIIYGGNNPGTDGMYNILRRCVARHDRSVSGLGQASFTNYTAKFNIFQNCISIDSDRLNDPTGNYASIRGPFFFEKGNDLDTSGPITVRGSIALNFSGAAIMETNSVTKYNNNTITDMVAWDGNFGLAFNYYWQAGKTTTVDHVTVGMIDGYCNYAEAGNGAGAKGAVSGTAIGAFSTNSIYYSIKANSYSIGTALYNVQGANDYNVFYANTINRTNSTIGSHDITNVNPITTSLKYLPRIETGSTLKGAGSGGSDIGATIVYRWGTSGSAYGESGYDTITTEPLWPWPNEDRIKADMRSYPSNWPSDGLPNPVRGFTAYSGKDGVHNTLTAYIWEYLGNQMPPEIYAATPVNGVCGSNNGGSFSSLSSSNVNNCSSGSVANFTGTGPWTWFCAGSNGGTSSSTCSATLSAGDTTPPAVTITTATPQSITTASLTVTGSASDASGVTECKYRIGAAPNASSGTACTGTTSWNCSTSGYSSGANNLYVGCADAAGNWPNSPPSITVNYTPPQIPPTTCTYYVRPDGHDSATGVDNTNNASTGAWLTLQHASNTVDPGDTVCVADGTYAGFYVETAGTVSHPITFKALGTGANITSRNSRTTDNINIESWESWVTNYITIDGFNVYNSPRIGIRAIAGAGIIIQNCTVRNNANTGILTAGTPSIQVLNNIVYANGSSSMQHNVYISNYGSNYPIVRGNSIYSANYGNGLQLNADWESGGDANGDSWIDYALIENNKIYNNALKGMSLISIRYATIRNNVLYGNGITAGAGGIHIVEQLSRCYSINNVVVNNTIDEPRIATVRINSGNTGNIVFNNVSVGPTGIVFEGSGNYQSANSTSSGGFANYAGHDYHLTSSSTAKDTGLASYQGATAPNIDIDGNSRPQNGSYDIGAYELGSSLGVINTLSVISISPE